MGLLHFIFQFIIMTTNTIHAASLSTKANVYFDGRCVSHSFKTASGEEKSVGAVSYTHLTLPTKRIV